MSEPIQFDYYYGIEAEQFSFYRVPRLLIKDGRFRGLSSDAKLLYGLMLDRMALSMKNGWLDEENRAYIIYTVENIMEDLGCSKPTCIKIMRELDMDSGIGLIEKKRRGLGKPDIIYVKNFASLPEQEPEKESANTDESTEVKNLYFKRERNLTSGCKESLPQGVKKFNFKKEKTLTSGSKETELQEVKEISPSYTDYNQTDLNQTEENHINPINQTQSSKKADSMDGIDDAAAYMELIRENIEYEYHMKYDGWQDRALYEELYHVICEIVCVKHNSVRIGGNDYPYELVKNRFLKLNSSHLEYVIGCMRDTTTKIGNIKAYMITALYNAPSTMNHYYQQEVNHDMYGGGWSEKGIV